MSFRTTPPPLHQFGDLSIEFPTPITLDNGIECYVIDGGSDDLNRVGIYLPGGTLMEPKPSVTLMTALMVVEGNDKMTAGELADAFDYYAVRKSSYSYDNWTEVTMTSLNDNFASTMQLLTDCVTRPSFPQEELDMWKRRIAGNLSVLNESVRYISDVEMRRLYYGKQHIMGRETKPEDIMGITRQDLIDFHKRYYTATGCKVIVSGKVTRDVIDTINSTIGKWQCATSAPAALAWALAPSDQMLSVVDKPGAVQSAVKIRIAAVKREHPDYLPLRILVDVLGGYFGSRLMANIREDKGYTYGIHAALFGSNNDGYIAIQCECATEHTWNVVKEVKYELGRLRDELIPLDELYTVKQDMLSSLAKTHDSPHNLARYVANTMLVGIYPSYHNDQLDCINNVTPEQLRDMARKYLRDDLLRIVIAGDKEQLNKIKQD